MPSTQDFLSILASFCLYFSKYVFCSTSGAFFSPIRAILSSLKLYAYEKIFRSRPDGLDRFWGSKVKIVRHSSRRRDKGKHLDFVGDLANRRTRNWGVVTPVARL